MGSTMLAVRIPVLIGPRHFTGLLLKQGSFSSGSPYHGLNHLISRQVLTRSASIASLSSRPCAKCGGLSVLLTRSTQWNGLIPRNLSTSQRLLHTTIRRIQQKKLPFEIDANVKQDTVIFSHHNDNFYRLISIFGIVQFLFWANLSIFTYSSLSALSTEEGKRMIKEDSWWGKILAMQSTYNYRIAALCMVVGYMVLFFTWVYPQRAVNKLLLLKGGRNVQITTYTHFGKKRSFTVPLEHLSSQHARATGKSQVSLKVKGRWFYFLMDNMKGKFHEPTLFDYAVGLKRNLK